ncbi:hypothetical protein HPB48_019081 [Haemaphysalis longicornis]|uniref:Uncharacterized protein n=1 Tax=Haemaphysalis longicornis TaxID=44386 RepID=A0A9J6G8Y6_HAELO|nr:hypothetical protein HPB48_019081 [Haemaphysalis longicornis]
MLTAFQRNTKACLKGKTSTLMHRSSDANEHGMQLQQQCNRKCVKDSLALKPALSSHGRCGWSDDGEVQEVQPPEGFTCRVCRMMEQSGKVFQEKLDRLQEKVSELEEQVRRADAERTLVAQLVCRVELLANKLAARASNEEESWKQQKQETEPGVGSREEMSSRMVNLALSQWGRSRFERAKEETPTEGDGVDGTRDTEETAEVQEISCPEREARDERTNKGSKPPTTRKPKNREESQSREDGQFPLPKAAKCSK